MRVTFILLIVALFLIASCSYEQPIDEKQSNALIFIVGDNIIPEPKIKTFVVGNDDKLAWFEETKQRRYHKNLRRYTKDYEDDLEEFEFRTKFKNVRRTIINDFDETELIFGYDKERDNPDFKKVDSKKMPRMYSKHYRLKIE